MVCALLPYSFDALCILPHKWLWLCYKRNDDPWCVRIKMQCLFARFRANFSYAKTVNNRATRQKKKKTMEKNRAHHILSLKHHIIQCAYIFTAIRRPHDHRLHYYHQHTLFMFCMCASSQLEMIFPFFSHNYAANGAATTDRGRFLLHTIIIHCRTLSLQHSQVLFTNCSQFVRLHLLLWH